MTFVEGVVITYEVGLLSMCYSFALFPAFHDDDNPRIYAKSAADAQNGIFCDPTKQPSKSSNPSKPIAITSSDFILGYKPTKDVKKIEATITNNKKEFKELIKHIDNGIIVNESDDKIYAVEDGKNKIIAKNKTGDDLTQENFGKNIKFIDSDKIINSVATNKNNSGSGVDINKLLNKFKKMEKTVGKLKKSNKLLQESNRTLQESLDSLKTSGGSSKNNSTNKDDITGLDARVASLEDFVKIDRKQLPSSNPKAGIGYFIHRNYTDIQSNTSQFDDVFKRLTRIEADITNNYAEFLQLRSDGTSLAARVTDIEAAVM